jgi:SPP1 gp7 family putative phage head morphogenesis protein
VSEAGEAAFTDLEIVGAFDVLDPGIVRFIERRGQRFGRQVNDTTWQMLAESLQEGVKAGESIDQLADRVETIMGGRIQSTPETIARTEVIGAANGATLDAWEQADVVEGKTWLAALDDRTRDAHVQAHGQTVPIDEPFIVNGEELDFPGADGSAENVVNCRCSMTAVLSERKVSQNGHVLAKEKQL